MIGRGRNGRRFRTVSIGRKPVYLWLAIPRVECRCCGAVRQMKMGFADPRVTYTTAFQRYALELSRYTTIKDVAEHLGVRRDMIKEIQKADLRRRFDRPKLKQLRQIAIDEISTAKGHVYLTIVLDLESGAVVHVGPGKGGEALFQKRFGSKSHPCLRSATVARREVQVALIALVRRLVGRCQRLNQLLNPVTCLAILRLGRMEDRNNENAQHAREDSSEFFGRHARD